MEKEIYSEMEILEKSHWWFLGRRKILSRLLKLNLPKKPIEILDFGCGTGGNFEILSQYGNITAIEMDTLAVEMATKKKKATVLQGDVVTFQAKLKDTFDFIISTDVLEHIDDDQKILEILHTMLKENGKILITVPAFQFLWSQHDTAHHHKRRYTKKLLLEKLQKSGFKIQYISYFNFWLFPIIALIRLLQSKKSKQSHFNDMKLPPCFINAPLKILFGMEKHIVGKLYVPFGVSLVAIATREDL